MAEQEQRGNERLSCNQEFQSLENMREYVTNLSKDGVFVRSDDPMPVGTLVKLSFTVITEDGFETIRGIGEVVRLSSNPRGMGLIFVELEPESQTLVQRLLSTAAEEPTR